MSCVFCDAPESVGTIVFDDERVLVLLHDDWAVAGHALVIARQHVQNAMSPGPHRDAVRFSGRSTHFAAVHHRVERALLTWTRTDRAMLKLGIQVPHLHVHIYPVAATASRTEVFAAFDGKARAELSETQRERFIDSVRCALT